MKLIKQLLKVLRTFEFVQLGLHAVVLHNLVEVLFVLVSVVNSYCNTLAAKSPCSSDTVDVAFWIATTYFICESQRGHIEVDNNLNFRNVNASSKHVGCDDHIDLAFTEFRHHLLAFFVAHITKHDGRLVVVFAQHILDYLAKFSTIYKDDSLCHCTSVKHIHDEVNFLFRGTSVLILLNMV